MSHLRSRLTYANIVATIALFIALGGGATAAILITGKNVKDGSLTGGDLKDNSVGSVDVKDGDLLAKDFKPGQLPAGTQGTQGPQGESGLPGTQGAQGEQGPKGDKGADGVVDKSALGTAKSYMGFNFSNPNVTVNEAALNDCVYINGAPNGLLLLRLDLPQGAQITNVRFHYYDNSATNLTFNLNRYAPSGGLNTFGTATSADAQPFNRFLDVAIVPALTVDNSQYAYILEVAPGETTSQSRLCGARVDYSV